MYIATGCDHGAVRGRRDDLSRRMDAQLQNWAICYCGNIGTENKTGGEGKSFIQADADAVEEQLLVMERWRPRYYRAVMLRYRNRWMDETSASAMRMPLRSFRDLMRHAYVWLDARLCERI